MEVVGERSGVWAVGGRKGDWGWLRFEKVGKNLGREETGTGKTGGCGGLGPSGIESIIKQRRIKNTKPVVSLGARETRQARSHCNRAEGEGAGEEGKGKGEGGDRMWPESKDQPDPKGIRPPSELGVPKTRNTRPSSTMGTGSRHDASMRPGWAIDQRGRHQGGSTVHLGQPALSGPGPFLADGSGCPRWEGRSAKRGTGVGKRVDAAEHQQYPPSEGHG